VVGLKAKSWFSMVFGGYLVDFYPFFLKKFKIFPKKA